MPRVVFASAGVGAGHHHAAHAVIAAIRKLDSQIEVRFCDVLDTSGDLFRLWYAGGYKTLVTKLPWLYGFGYRMTDRPRGPRRRLGERVRLWQERRALRKFRQFVWEDRPTLVVNTHYVAAPGVAHLVRRDPRGVRQVVVVTDNEFHRWWYSEEVERYFVPNDDVVGALLEDGIPRERIEVTGIPAHPKWRAPLSEEEIRRAWSLPADKQVVILAGGVEFTIGRIDQIAQQICQRVQNVVLVVLAGGNKDLLARLAALPMAQGDNPRLRGISYTDRVHELVHVASLVITKPGGMMTTECCIKGAAMMLMKPVPGQEEANARYFSAHGAAVLADSPEEILEKTVHLLEHPDELAAVRRSAAALAKPATETISRWVVDYVHAWAKERAGGV